MAISQLATLILSAGADYVTAIAQDATYIYIGCLKDSTTDSYIVRVNKGTFIEIDKTLITSSTGAANPPRHIIPTVTGGGLIVIRSGGHHSSASRVANRDVVELWNAATMTVLDTIDIGATQGYNGLGAAQLIGNALYVAGTQTTFIGGTKPIQRIFKITHTGSTLTLVSSISIVTNISVPGNPYLIDSTINDTSEHIYFLSQGGSSGTAYTRIHKMNVASFVISSTLDMAAGIRLVTDGTDYMDATFIYDGFLYFGTKSTPAKVHQIDLTSFLYITAITLAGNNCRTIMKNRGWAACGLSHNSPNATVIEVDLDGFWPSGSSFVATNTAERFPFFSTVESDNATVGYYGTQSPAPARIVKVGLSDPLPAPVIAVPVSGGPNVKRRPYPYNGGIISNGGW